MYPAGPHEAVLRERHGAIWCDRCSYMFLPGEVSQILKMESGHMAPGKLLLDYQKTK